MSLNGSGVYVPPAASFPAVGGTLIESTKFNAVINDLGVAMSTAIFKDGQQTVTANIPFNGFKLTGVGSGTLRTDAANVGNVVNGTGVYSASVGGTADAVTIAPSPAITAYAAGQTFRFIASGANTTAVTIDVNGLGVKAVTKNGTTALVAGDIPSGSMVTVTYDGTRFILGSIGNATAPSFFPAITAKGDIYAGSGAGALTIRSAGTDGYRLVADSTQASGLNYEVPPNVGLQQSFSGLSLRTHFDSDVVNNKVALTALKSVVMNDGVRYVDAVVPGTDAPLVADMTASGAGGLDTSTEQASTWYKILLIGKSSTKVTSDLRLMFHRAKDYFKDQEQATADAAAALRDATARTRLAQGFQLATAGKVEFIDWFGSKTSTPTGNFWFTIEADSAGDPSGTPLATSDKYDVARLTATNTVVRMPFRSPATLSTATQYHLVMYGDNTINGTAYATWAYKNTTNPYANGSAKQYNGTVWSAVGTTADFRFAIYVTRNETADNASMPSGWDQFCQVGWVYNNVSSNFKLFSATDRFYQAVGMGSTGNWAVGSFTTTAVLTDIFAFVPPKPVGMLFRAFHASSNQRMIVGDITVTDIAQAETIQGLKLSLNLSTNVNDYGAIVASIPVQYGAVYGLASGASTFLLIDGFTW